jgi:hypothetical protein
MAEAACRANVDHVRSARACSLVITLGLGLAVGVGAAARSADATDCMDRFPEGRFGISLSRPVVAKLVVPEFSPLYVVTRAVSVMRPDDCRYVYTSDVFRMVDTPAAGAVLAGCVGDFDGDGRNDVALLMRRARDASIAPFVFQARAADYHVLRIEGITDPYGFAEDKTIWPGPFCIPKPPDGVFRSAVDGHTIGVVGALFTIGWKTYFWNSAARRFDAILTSD